MQRILGAKQNRWAQFQVEILLFVSLSDLLAFLWAKDKPECCDVNSYIAEAASIRTHGFFPTLGIPWLYPIHNYIYPTFLFLIRSVGLTSRSSITNVQFALIIVACIFVSTRLFKVLGLSFIQLAGLTLLAAFFPILAFSGYLLTEGLASSLFIMWIGLWLELAIKQFSFRGKSLMILSISLFASLLWMTRPAFSWVPLASSICILLLEFERKSSWGHRIRNWIRSTFLIFTASVIVAAPQYLVTKNSRLVLNGLFHFDDWARARTFESYVFRYVTNMSGCGPADLIFSPFGQTTVGLNSSNFQISPVYRFIGFIARVVSGWDTVPTPLTFADHLSIFPWIFLSALSGFIITAPFFLIWKQKTSSSNFKRSFRIAEIGIFIMFMASQLAMGITHGEIRYNIAGWIIAAFSLLLLPQHFKDAFPVRKYVTNSLLVSLFVIVIGQLTLSLSQIWVSCVR
jgi:hypothetical protein